MTASTQADRPLKGRDLMVDRYGEVFGLATAAAP
ncbi:MAG: hypothetical protein JWO27_1800 [Frankiales bacterium]|jgi:hypothetical protein|nr:hypothetical protein [Frankiales bacterium]